MAAAGGRTRAQNIGLVLGLAALVATLVIEPPAGTSAAAWTVAGTMVLMATWWATEALPFAATALVPLAILPPLGAASASSLAAGYGNTTLFLILGGFLLGLAMERCNLHRRIAYAIVARAGGQAQALVLGMMCATGFVSMWVQNTSTTLMMLPVAVSIATIVAPDTAAGDRNARNFASAIVLCVAYAATIGGLGTLVGTATNALVVGFMQQNYGETISFAQWLAFGIPTVLLLMPIAWLVLVKIAFPFQLGSQTIARDRLIEARAALGPMTTAERRVTTVFVVTALAWITGPLLRQLPGLAEFNDTTIALLAGLFLFLIQNGSKEGGALLTGPDLRRVPWDVLLLFGGGLALAEAIQGSGLSGGPRRSARRHRRLAARRAARDRWLRCWCCGRSSIQTSRRRRRSCRYSRRLRPCRTIRCCSSWRPRRSPRPADSCCRSARRRTPSSSGPGGSRCRT